MARYLDFENEKFEKGFKPFELTATNIKANIGKRICYVHSRDHCPYRGSYSVRYARIHGKRYSQLIINEGHDSIDIRSVLECGIEIEPA
jgi:hypothetical protein